MHVTVPIINYCSIMYLISTPRLMALQLTQAKMCIGTFIHEKVVRE